jgi:hypothetical protein
MSARSKSEAAMKAFLEVYYSGLVYTGTRGEIKDFPCVVVVADSGEEVPIGSGNTMLDVTITVQDQIDEAGEPNSTARFDEAVDKVQDAIRYDDFETQLSGKASDFHCLGLAGRSGQETVYDDQSGMIAEVFKVSLLIAEADL